MLLILWILLVLYPNPIKLVESLHRLAKPEVDPVAVQALAAEMPSDDPAAIERAVLDRLPYGYDWEVYSMPWYYPTVGEALENHQGDCKARAIVLASILEAKGIPYRINSSTTHVWVEYTGKMETRLESSQTSLYVAQPQTGQAAVRLPTVRVGDTWSTYWRGFWPPMPLYRKVMLLFGPFALITLRILWPRWRRLADALFRKTPAPVRAA